MVGRSGRDYYSVLGVSPDATPEAIREAFRRCLARVVEQGVDDPGAYRELIDAYHVLSDSERRAEYDRLREAGALEGWDVSLIDRLSESLERIREQLDPENLETALPSLVERAGELLNKLQVNKVRLKHRGRPITPDIPLIYGLLLEAGGLWAGGLIRLLIANLGIKALLDVEIVNDAEEVVARGDERYAAGEVDEAVATYREALRIDRTYVPAWYKLGVVLRVRGEAAEARRAFERVVALDSGGEWGEKAREQLRRLDLG
jgi:tetratricopeptide (TPR) repeat protein